jgi:hypothetical protein
MKLGIGSALRAAMLVLSLGLVWQGVGCAGGDKEQASGDEMSGGEDAGSGSAEEGKKKKKGKKKKAKKAK